MYIQLCMTELFRLSPHTGVSMLLCTSSHELWEKYSPSLEGHLGERTNFGSDRIFHAVCHKRMPLICRQDYLAEGVSLLEGNHCIYGLTQHCQFDSNCCVALFDILFPPTLFHVEKSISHSATTHGSLIKAPGGHVVTVGGAMTTRQDSAQTTATTQLDTSGPASMTENSATADTGEDS